MFVGDRFTVPLTARARSCFPSPCVMKGGPYLGALRLLRLSGASTAQAGAPGTAGNPSSCQGSTASTDHGLPVSVALKFSVPTGLPLREKMFFPGITLGLLLPGADHSNLSTGRRNYAAES